MATTTARTTSTTNPKESTMSTTTATKPRKTAKAAPADPAKLKRAAVGTAHIADLAIETYRKALAADLTPSRIDAARNKAMDAMDIANHAAKAAGSRRNVFVLKTVLLSTEQGVREARMTHNPAKAEQPTVPAKPAAKVASKPAAQSASVKAKAARANREADGVDPRIEGGFPKPGSKAAKPRSIRRPKVTPDKVVLHEVETINRADGSVDGHKAGCADIAKVTKRERLDRSGPMKVTTKHDAWLDYNTDFLPECEGCEGHDEAAGVCAHAYDINWLSCAKAVPEFASPAAKPVTKVASKPAAQAKSAKPVAAGASKAAALGDYLRGAGWAVKVTEIAPHTVVMAARDGEVLNVRFIDGKMDDVTMPTYQRADGSIVKMRNVSAIRKQADTDPAKRPVKTVRTVTVRAKSVTPAVAAEEASRSLDIDVKSCEVDDLQKYLSERTIWWRRSAVNGGGISEARVWSVRTVITTPSGRAMEFIEAVQTKRGWAAGPVRCVPLKSIRLG